MNISGENPFFVPITESQSSMLEEYILCSEFFVDYPLEQIFQFFWRVLSYMNSSSLSNGETVELFPLVQFNNEINLTFNPSFDDQLNLGFYKDIFGYIESYYELLFGHSVRIEVTPFYIIAYRN